MQYPPKLAGYPFICELCTVRVHLHREVDPLNIKDRKLLALERSRIIDLTHGWASSTLETYLRLLHRHKTFRQSYDLPSLPPPNIPHPPYDDNIIIFWHMEEYTCTLSKKAKNNTPKFNSARAFRSAFSAYSALCAALCKPQNTFKDRDLRLLTLPAVGASDTISATMIAHGMAVRLGTHTQSSMALFQRHIHRNQDLRLEALNNHGLTPQESYGLIAANCIELLGFMGWLRGTEVFSLRREDVEIIHPDNHLLHDLPVGVGCLLFTLLPSTKSSQTDFVDIVIAYTTSGGLRPGFWFEYLFDVMNLLGWTDPKCFLFRQSSGEQWTSGFFRTKYLFPFLSLQREEGDIHFRGIDDTPDNNFSTKFYSFHTYRISGNTHSLRKRDGCNRRASPIERTNHGRWRIKYRGIESMPMHYQQPSVSDLIQITLNCF